MCIHTNIIKMHFYLHFAIANAFQCCYYNARRKYMTKLIIQNEALTEIFFPKKQGLLYWTVGTFTIQHLLHIVNVFSLHYRVKGVLTIYEIFKGKIAEQKKLRHLTNADIGKMTGYSSKTIDAFMSGARESDRLAKAIAEALNIKR